MRLLKLILQLLMPWTWFGRIFASEPVPAPVQRKSSANSTTSTPNIQQPAPVPFGTDPEPVHSLKRKPSAAEQAQALLEVLHGRFAGKKVRSADVKAISYPQLVEAMDWRAQGWDGKDGVGVHLGRLTGGRTFAWFTVDGERKRQRAYAIPLAITVRKRA
jgi:hypothetical protein